LIVVDGQDDGLTHCGEEPPSGSPPARGASWAEQTTRQQLVRSE